jgi:hypothetical protein
MLRVRFWKVCSELCTRRARDGLNEKQGTGYFTGPKYLSSHLNVSLINSMSGML